MSGATPWQNRSAFARWCGRVAMRLFGWRVEGAMPAGEPRIVIAVAPHTSNWDFLLCMGSMFWEGLDIHWIAKHTLFKGPMGVLFRALGGVPIDRSNPGGIAESVAARMRAAPFYMLALAPEGTRKRVEHWKSGFHRIAERANAVIVPVSIDYSRKVVGIGAAHRTTDDPAADIVALRKCFTKQMALKPENFVEVSSRQ